MADIKTHLRELSVIYGLWHFFQKIRPNTSTLSVSNFWETCEIIIPSDIHRASNILDLK
ncbi:MAG: hypothetical protein WCI00_05585 [bacterium]